jgi:hypothetical protein
VAIAGFALAPAVARADAANLSEREAIRIASRDAKVRAERAEHPGLRPVANLDGGDWRVDYYRGEEDRVQVTIDDATGLVRESWTGHQVAWRMARGYEGQFGHKLNAPYVWLPLCAIFLLGLIDWRRPLRVASLDLLVLLSFGVSHYFFNRGEIGVSVPLAYPALLYLLARCLWIGFRGRGDGLRPVWPASWLLIAALFLVGFRVGLNVVDSGVIDVGYSGVVGADRIVDGDHLYGADAFPEDNPTGDTYGPVNYYAYVPFEQALPWSGSWDELPAGHGAAIAFDLFALAGLWLLGRRSRPGPEGKALGATLAFAWAAYPYTGFVLQSNANDTLIAALLIAALLLAARPAARGAAIALASLAKFAPLVLAPMFATHGGKGQGTAPGSQARPRRRAPLVFSGAFAAVAALVMLQTLLDPGLGTFLDRTLGSQVNRDSPFSIWGQVGGLEPLRIGLIAATGALALGLALAPREKSLAQLAALTAALMLSVQLTLEHWFYLYIVWFTAPLLVALMLIRRPGSGSARSTPQDHRGESQPPPPSPTRPRPRSRSAPASA